MRVYIENYGCSANQAEAEIMAGLIEKSGAEIVLFEDLADIVIINSCIVKQVTEQKIFDRIKDFQRKGKKIIVSGCMPEGAHDRIVMMFPEISLVSTHRIKEIVNAVNSVSKGKRVELLGESRQPKLCLPRIRKNPIIDIVEISEGCTGACTYCATRLTKGKIFSYPKNEIIKEISMAVDSGCKEIWLTSQDTGAYGLEHGQRRLPDLLNSVSKIPGNFFVRLGMINPNHVIPILKEMINAYNSKKIYKFLHLPVQSGSDEILKKMNRLYTAKDFVEIVNAFRNSFRMNIWTDIIVGYPEETEEQFEESIKLIKLVKPDYVNISRFAKRPGTPAADMKQLDTKEMKERTRKISDIVEKISREKNNEWLGWKGDILISEKGKFPGQWMGRNFAYKLVVIDCKDCYIGKSVKVEIVGAFSTSLVGKIIE